MNVKACGSDREESRRVRGGERKERELNVRIRSVGGLVLRGRGGLLVKARNAAIIRERVARI